jgi:phosphonate transport system permease protein
MCHLFADVQTKGSLAWWGYRLPIQLPLIWETLQLALASTLVASPLPRYSRFCRQ